MSLWNICCAWSSRACESALAIGVWLPLNKFYTKEIEKKVKEFDIYLINYKGINMNSDKSEELLEFFKACNQD